jgi:amino acid adenylation domain-containing protein
MDRKFSFDCLLIGTGSLLIECAQILMESNYRVIGIVSPDQAIASWAEKNNLVYYKNLQQFKLVFTQASCDYLFSIVNQTILEPEILDLADLAINYHDALLPTYAGLNATSWAIIKGEKYHGITWHEMSQGIDTGKILKQVKIELDSSETALTLNTKCYQAAITSFQGLITELETKKITVKAQDLRKRSYFPRHQKPPRFGIIDFNCDATVIDNLVRGLNFGNYPNPLGTAKLVLNSTSGLDCALDYALNYVVVTQVKVLEAQSTQLPGTIVGIEQGQLIVATASQDIALATIVNQQNQPQAIAQLAADYQLAVGQKLPEIDPSQILELVQRGKKNAPSETYWLQQLSQKQSLSLPFEQPATLNLLEPNHNSSSRQNNQQPIKLVKLSLSPKVTDLFGVSLEVPIAAWAIYLARLSGNHQLTLGFDRLTADPWFARYVPCNLKISLEQDFAQVLKTVKKRLALNQKHQTHSTDLMVRYPQLEANQTDFSVIVTQLNSETQAGLVPDNSSPSHLTLIVDQQGAEYWWSYNPEVFSAKAIAIMVEQWITLLEGIVRNVTAPVSQLPLISPAERQKILEKWNDTASNYPHDRCLHQLFEVKAAENPQAVALVCQGESLTYGELEQQAHQLACYLQSLGVQEETLVGVCLDRSLAMIVSLFAILKAGGAYLPLDPNYPIARLTYLLEDAGAEILITQSKLRDCLPTTSPQVVCLDQDWQRVLVSNNNLVSQVNSHNLAYVIYTSGSTGNPKGVEIEHHSVVNTLCDLEQRFKVTSQDRILAVSSLSFDLSVYDIFGVLGSGGTVIMPQPEHCPNPEHWLELMTLEQVTIWNSAPALMELLIDYLVTNHQPLPPSLRLVLLSGDRISPNLVMQLQTLNPQLQIISLGGATEASIWSIYYPIDYPVSAAKTIPYGRPLKNQSFYILDPKLQLMPVGATGELYIGGFGIARGYLHRQELTATKFIPNPFLKQTTLKQGSRGERLYKTGDLGRYLEDGNIEFLGRIDNQVKIRGVRIELGEIETTLLQYPGIKESVVAVSKTEAIAANSSSQTSLVAYCVLKSNFNITSGQLRDFLRSKLPAHAIPATFVFLDTFPLTSNGKIDRQALAVSPVNQQETAKDFLPPQDRLEWQLSQIWSRILNVKPIGRNDNFFELGGNSLLALRLFEQIQSTFGKNLPLATLFQAPTIAQLASLMLEQGWSASWSSLVSIQPHGDRSPLFCIHAIGGNVLAYRLIVEALGTERPVYGLQARGLDGKQTALTSVEEMATNYLEEIKLIQPQGPYFLLGHSFGGFVAWEMAQQLTRQGETIAVLALLDTYGPNYQTQYTKFDLSQWVSIHLNNISKLSLEEKLAYLQERLEYTLRSKIPQSWQQKYSQIAELRLSPEHKLMSRIGKLNLAAEKQYTPSVYPGKLTLFRAQIRRPYGFFDPDGGWNGMASGGITVEETPGDHISMLLKQENSELLAAKLKAVFLNAVDQAQYSNCSQPKPTYNLTPM